MSVEPAEPTRGSWRRRLAPRYLFAAIASGLLIVAALAMVVVAGIAAGSVSTGPVVTGTVRHANQLPQPAKCTTTKHRKCSASAPPVTVAPAPT